MIIQIIIEILATGGAATVERAAAVLLKSFKKIFESIFKLTGKAAAKSAEIFDTILDLLASLKQQSKNLKPLLDYILEFLRVLLGAIPKDLGPKAKVIQNKKGQFDQKIELSPGGGSYTIIELSG
ncbi:MAG TPA: hypothetical protein VF602_07710 [Pedobacter sp.]|jgi:DNA-binding ferritin-like protein (Dps family)